MFIVTSKTNFYVFQSASRVVVFRLMTPVFCTSQHRVGVDVNISPFDECLKISSKKIFGNAASSYQVNLVKEILNITENYINSHVITCRQWVSAMLI